MSAKPNASSSSFSSSAPLDYEIEDDEENDKIPASMKTLHFYLTRQVLATLAMTVTVFTFVLLLGEDLGLAGKDNLYR